MKIEKYSFPQSSFLSIDKDLNQLLDLIYNNNNLLKLLYWNTPDALTKSNLNPEQMEQLKERNIKIIPRLKLEDNEQINTLIITFDSFNQSSNPEFRDGILELDIICNFDQWYLSNGQLRPYRIAGELDAMLNQKKLSGFGKLDFIGASQLLINEEIGGVCLLYNAVHGGEDKHDAENPKDQIMIEDNFNEMFNE